MKLKDSKLLEPIEGNNKNEGLRLGKSHAFYSIQRTRIPLKLYL